MPFNAWGFVPESHYGRGRRRSSTSSANIPITLVAGKSIKSSHEGSGSTTEQSSRRRHHSSTTEISAVPPSEELSSAPPPASTWTSSAAVEGGSEELQDIEEDMKSTKLDDIPETEGTALPPSPTDDITEPPAMEGDASQVPTETNHTGPFPSMTDTRAGPLAGGRREPDIDWDAIDRAARKRHERGKSGATTTKPSSTGDAKTSMRSFGLSELLPLLLIVGSREPHLNLNLIPQRQRDILPPKEQKQERVSRQNQRTILFQMKRVRNVLIRFP